MHGPVHASAHYSTFRHTPIHNPWQYVLVDEFQDTSHTQFQLLTLLAGEAGRITVVGDDDQAIYGFQVWVYGMVWLYRTVN